MSIIFIYYVYFDIYESFRMCVTHIEITLSETCFNPSDVSVTRSTCSRHSEYFVLQKANLKDYYELCGRQTWT